MHSILRFILRPLSISAVGFLLLSALIWWALPLINFGNQHPFDATWVRAGLIVLLGSIVTGFHAWSWYKRMRANAALIEGMMQGASASDRETTILNERFANAIQVLKEGAKGNRTLSSMHGKQYLYDLPWYVFIGAPGSGKTTALLNAGLHFPLSEKLGQASVRGVGGTRNCDWWFTDQAVLIDTAGRYALQESDSTADASAWNTFLSLLKQTRQRRPLNGVLLTINVQDLLQQSPQERSSHAAKLRARIQELHDKLGIRPPVYVLVTKVDLLAGFNETLAGLGKEEREQVWGFTFAGTGQQSPNDLVNAFETEFSSLENLIRNRLIERMEGERDVLRRANIFAFPQQLSVLKDALGPFLNAVFGGTDALAQRPMLRGVYLTSGTQEGTPIDRVLGTLARSFGVEQRITDHAGQRGKSFFLQRLLQEVVFAEQGLVGENRALAQRKKQWRMASMAAMAVLASGLLIGWSISYVRNSTYIDEVAARVPEIQKQLDNVPSANSGNVSPVVGALGLVHAAAAPANFPQDQAPISYRFGLYQGDKLRAGTELGYHRVLDHGLMPRITMRLEERLRTATRGDLEFAYEALKTYLMLYTPEEFDPQALKPWITLDWEANLNRSLTPSQLAELETSLDDMLRRTPPQPVVPMDTQLVESVREMLTSFPLEYRVFSRLKRLNLAEGMPDFSVAAAVGPNANRAFIRASGEPLTRGIPALFTRDGYYNAFSAALENAVKQLATEERWVLGFSSSGNPNIMNKVEGIDSEMSNRVRRLYLEEYIKRWDAYIADVRLIKLEGLEQSLQVAKLMAAPDSPIAAYLRAVSRETQLVQKTLDREEKNIQGNIGDKIEDAERVKRQLSALTGMATSALGMSASSSSQAGPIEQMVDDHFADIFRLFDGNPAPITESLKLFNDVYIQLAAVDAAQKSKAPPPAASGGTKVAAGLQPEPIRSVLTALAESTDSQSRVAERQGLSSELKPITDFCTRTIAGRYPFAPGSKADALPDDFGHMFGAGGLIDDFYQRRLANMVDTGANQWSFKPLPDGTRPAGGASLVEFQRAARIKEVFFRSAGRTPAFRIDVRAIEMDEGLQEVSLDIDGQLIKFVPGNTVASSIQWPPTRLASQVRLSTVPASSTPVFEGTWALFRMFDRFEVKTTTQPERFHVVLNLDGRKMVLEVISSTAFNPFRLREMQQFRCPGAL